MVFSLNTKKETIKICKKGVERERLGRNAGHAVACVALVEEGLVPSFHNKIDLFKKKIVCR
jgi:hypothetical protein